MKAFQISENTGIGFSKGVYAQWDSAGSPQRNV
jgi:hypothetical protein